MKDRLIYVERVSSRPYVKRRGESDYQRHTNFNRKGVDCAMCAKYPCFGGIENISSNLAITCKKFTIK